MLDYFIRKPTCRILLLFFFVFTPISQRSFANNEIHKAVSNLRPSGPYCGLYCLYTIMVLADVNTDFRQLVKPEYLGSKKGSSLTELKKASLDNGLYAQVVMNLTMQELKASRYPIILHVKKDNARKEYDHYKLFLGSKDDKAAIFDPPSPMGLLSFYELVPQWDGTGLIVSTEPIELGVVFASARKRFMIWSAIAVGFILVLRWVKMRWLKGAGELAWHKVLGLSVVQGGAFVVLALVVGMSYHFVTDAGFLAHADATSSIQQANAVNFIPKVSKEKVGKLLGGDAVFIDARMARDYEAGHLEGSISIPVNAEDEHRREAMAGVTKDAEIVIYCQSSGCPYAGKVAAKLKTDGFSNISIFKGGWNEWKTKDDGKG